LDGKHDSHGSLGTLPGEGRTSLGIFPTQTGAASAILDSAAGWITPEQAVETLNDCDCLQLIAPKEAHGDKQQG